MCMLPYTLFYNGKKKQEGSLYQLEMCDTGLNQLQLT